MWARKQLGIGLGLAVALWLASGAGTQAQHVVSLKATMIHASDKPSAQDSRLDNIEYQLRRTFRFEYYKHIGEGSASVNLPGVTVLSLGSGFQLNLSAADAGKGKVRAAVQWMRGNDVVLNTTVVMTRRIPVVLGGISHEGGTLIVTLVAE
ncbi:MAG: hypothetical protein KA248_08035 [Kiritimatiellae bacterium]|nr:hypothetical protein [Kiritimatiellia bacterium]